MCQIANQLLQLLKKLISMWATLIKELRSERGIKSRDLIKK